MKRKVGVGRKKTSEFLKDARRCIRDICPDEASGKRTGKSPTLKLASCAEKNGPSQEGRDISPAEREDAEGLGTCKKEGGT